MQNDLQAFVELEPQEVTNLGELQKQARSNTGLLRGLRDQIDDIDKRQRALINDGRVDEALPLDSVKVDLEKKLQKRRMRSEALRRRRDDLQTTQRKATEEKERREREEVVESRNPGKQRELDVRKLKVSLELEGIAQESDRLLRTARNNQDTDLARRLMALQRGTVAALEALKRTPSLDGMKEDNG